MSLLAVCKNHDTVCCRECFPLPQWVDIADVKDLESQLAQANKRIGEQIRDIEAMREFEENQSRKLAQSREEIVWWKEKANGSLDMANQALDERDYLQAKLSKLERVRVAAQRFYYALLPECERLKDGGGTCFGCELEAALRETEGR